MRSQHPTSQPSPVRPTSRYVERLWPAWWVWGCGVLAGASLGVAWLRVGDGTQSIAVSAAGIVLFLAGLALTTPVIRVDEESVRAGRAVAPRWAFGEVRPLDADELRHVLGRGLDARAFLCQRGWIHTAVMVTVIDPDDPTPHWVLSSRRPEALAAALRGRHRT